MTTSASSHWISPDLVARAQQGDHAAFAAIVTHHQADLWGYVYRLLRDRADDVDDVVQQTWILAWQYLTTSGSPAHHDPQLRLAGWLYRLALTVSRNAQFRAQRHPSVSWDRLRAAGGAAYAASEPLTRHETGPEGAALQREDAAELQALLRQLPARDREAVVLRDGQEWPYPALAQRWGLGLGGAKVRVRMARRRFRAVYAVADRKPPLPSGERVPPGVSIRAPMGEGRQGYVAYALVGQRTLFLGRFGTVRAAVAARRAWETAGGVQHQEAQP